MHESEKISITTHSIKSRFIIRPSNILFAGVYVCTFQPGHFTGCGSVGVKYKFAVHQGKHWEKGRVPQTYERRKWVSDGIIPVWDQPFIFERDVELSQLLEAEFTTHCTTFEASKESGGLGDGW